MKINISWVKIILISGILLVLLGLFSNEMTLTALFSPDGDLQTSTRIKILIFNILSIAGGIIIILKRNSIRNISSENVRLFFGTLLICLVGLEVFLRIWLPTSTKYSSYMLYEEVAEENRIISPHHYLNYYLTPNYRSRNGLNRHNLLGYRGDEIEIPKPEGRFRIVVLGGSSTYTDAVEDYRKSFTYILQTILRDKYGYDKVEVVNAGVGGYSSFESLINLEFRVLDIEPDLIIVYHGTNDVHARLVPPSLYKGDNSGRRKQWFIPKLGILDWVVFLRIMAYRLDILPNQNALAVLVDTPTSKDGVMGYNKQIGGDPTIVLNNNPPKYFERNLINMIAIAKANHVEILLTTWAFSPLFADYAATSHYQKGFAENNNMIRDLAARQEIAMFDFAKLMPNFKELWSDGRHVNERGAVIKAELFAEFLNDQKFITREYEK